MTYLLYTAWVGCIMLAAGELDLLVRRLLAPRFRLSYPEAPWWMVVFASACFPGLGQFLNGQPLKALLLIAWPFLTMFRAPIPPPWQMIAIKSLWFLLPAWALGLLDALVVSIRAEQRRRAATVSSADRGHALTAFLERRENTTNAGRPPDP